MLHDVTLHDVRADTKGPSRLANPNLDFEIRISDFAIKREIRKRITPPRDMLTPRVIFINKKKYGSEFAFR